MKAAVDWLHWQLVKRGHPRGHVSDYCRLCGWLRDD